jgi:hypothetical protein
MTVKELIEKLEKVKNKELEIVVKGIDPTGWKYYNEVEMLGKDKVYLSEDDKKKTEVFIIDGGMF